MKVIMELKATCPSLTTDGWTDEPLKVIDYCLLNFFSSLHSQSNMFFGKVLSFAFLTQKNKNDPEGLATDIASEITSLLTQYFNNVQVTTKVIPSNNTRREIIISGHMQSNTGEIYDLSRVFTMENSSLISVLSINNGV